MAAHLAGNWPGVRSPGINVIVRFFTPGTQTEIHKSAAATDASGNFDVYDAPVGTYDVGIKSDNSLSELATSLVFTEGGTTAYTFPSWKGGDLNNDDYVDNTDPSILLGNYDKWGPCYGYAGNWLMPAPPAAGGGIATKFNRGFN